MPIERFEDLKAWQKARLLTSEIYTATRQPAMARDLGLARQMQRASVSIMANLAEGFERGGMGEFHQFLSTAKSSCAELRSHLYVALDAGYLSQPDFERLMAQAEETGKVIGALRVSVEKRRDLNRGKP